MPTLICCRNLELHSPKIGKMVSVPSLLVKSYTWSHSEQTWSHCILYLALGLSSAAVSFEISSSPYLQNGGHLDTGNFSYTGAVIIAHYRRDSLVKLDTVEQVSLLRVHRPQRWERLPISPKLLIFVSTLLHKHMKQSLYLPLAAHAPTS